MKPLALTSVASLCFLIAGCAATDVADTVPCETQTIWQSGVQGRPGYPIVIPKRCPAPPPQRDDDWLAEFLKASNPLLDKNVKPYADAVAALVGAAERFCPRTASASDLQEEDLKAAAAGEALASGGRRSIIAPPSTFWDSETAYASLVAVIVEGGASASEPLDPLSGFNSPVSVFPAKSPAFCQVQLRGRPAAADAWLAGLSARGWTAVEASRPSFDGRALATRWTRTLPDGRAATLFAHRTTERTPGDDDLVLLVEVVPGNAPDPIFRR